MGHPPVPSLTVRHLGRHPAPPYRWARAAVSAVAATVLGLSGHVAAGGVPTLGGVALALLAVVVPSWLLAGRERDWTTIAAVQIAAQQVVHPVLVTASHAAAPDLLPHDVMFFLHVLGALLLAVWLRVGERRTWAMARRLAAHLARWTRGLFDAPPAPLPRPRRMRPVADLTLAPTDALWRTVRRRGPPLPA